MKKLLNVKELAGLLGCSTSALYTMVSENRIPYRKVGRLTRFALDDIEAWMKEHASSARDYTD
jgi:excisionase family DNA binding protein